MVRRVPSSPRGDGRTSRAVRLALALALTLGIAGAAAQIPPWAGGRWRAAAVHEGIPPQSGGFSFCRLLYDQVRREPGGQGWSTDYPVSDGNFMTRLSQFTSVPINRWS